MNATFKRANPGAPTRFPSQTLRTAFAAVRVSFTWLGVRKSLSPDQKAQAAERFGAEGTFLSAGEKLIDTPHAAFQALVQNRDCSVSGIKQAAERKARVAVFPEGALMPPSTARLAGDDRAPQRPAATGIQ